MVSATTRNTRCHPSVVRHDHVSCPRIAQEKDRTPRILAQPCDIPHFAHGSPNARRPFGPKSEHALFPGACDYVCGYGAAGMELLQEASRAKVVDEDSSALARTFVVY